MRALTAALTVVMAFGVLLGSGSVASANALAGGGYSSSYAGESVFLGKAAGETGQFSAIFFNDGTQTWAPGVVGLLICMPDKVTCNVASPNAAYASGWYSATVYATVTSSVAPGQNGFFIYNFAVPAGTAGGTVTTFNGDVGLIATAAELRPEGYYQQNTTPAVTGTLSISPTSASMAVGGQQQFTATTNLTGTVSWSTTGGCGAVTSGGLFVSTATTSSTQPCTVVASIGSLTASATITVYGPATKLACSASPSTIVAGGGTNGTSTVTVTVEDANGQTVTASTPAITITNATSSLATVSPSGSLAATNGVLTVTVTSTATTGQIVVSAASSSSITGCTALITSGSAGAAAKTAITFTVNPIAADGTSTTGLQVDVQDANGNRVTGDSSTTIDLSLQSGAGVCTVVGVTQGTSPTFGGGAGTATDVQGRVVFTVRSTTTPGTCVFTATPRNTSISSSTGSLTTQIVGYPNKLTVTANDSPHAAGSASTTTVTVAIFDAVGHQVTGANNSITATLDTGSCTGAGGGDVLIASPAGGTTAATGGQAVFTFTSNGAYSGCSVTFSSSGLASATATIVFTPGAADHLGCAFSPASIKADGSSVSTGLVYVRDQLNNNLTTGSYSVNFAFSGSGAVTTQLTTSPQTTSNGVAAFQVKSTTSVGTDTYTPSLASGSLPTIKSNQTCQIQTQ